MSCLLEVIKLESNLLVSYMDMVIRLYQENYIPTW